MKFVLVVFLFSPSVDCVLQIDDDGGSGYEKIVYINLVFQLGGNIECSVSTNYTRHEATIKLVDLFEFTASRWNCLHFQFSNDHGIWPLHTTWPFHILKYAATTTTTNWWQRPIHSHIKQFGCWKKIVFIVA